MIEIELSYINNSDQDEQTLTAMVDEFSAKQDVKVHLRMMTWDSAWAELLNIASHGSGPDISHIGGTWVSSLARMNALRPFQPHEIAEMGGGSSFMRPTWESTSLFEDERIWSMPWTGWIYLVCYRKDLLKKAGVNVSNAFSTIEAFDETMQTLKNSSLEIPWLNPHINPPYTDLLHIAASWVWAAGGDFINNTGTQVAFDGAKAIEGLRVWLETYRAVPQTYRHLQLEECSSLFREGRVGAMLTDIRQANELIDIIKDPLVLKNLGVATLTNVPWTGGGNFVIWDHIRGHYERERAALELVKFLVSKESNVRWRQGAGQMPARIDALEEIYPPENPLHEPIQLAARKGRAYYNIPLWRRIEYQLSQALGAVVKEANENPSADSASILRGQLEPLAQRLNLTLSN